MAIAVLSSCFLGCDDEPLEPRPDIPDEYAELLPDILEDLSDENESPDLLDEESTPDLPDEADEAEDDAADETELPPATLREQLEAIPGMHVVSQRTLSSGAVFFSLRFSQPVDHDQAEGPQFEQRLSLLHLDQDGPMNLVSTGYDDYIEESPAELTLMLDANQLVIEHRFFGESVPEPLDWSYLCLEQAAADHHRVVEAFKPIYPGVWVSSGASKGGQASVFHRRFYPDDVEVTVAYESPLIMGAPDERFADFIEAIPEPDCQAKLLAVQNEALARRAELSDILDNTDYTFELLGGEDTAVESLVISLPFTYWQYTGVDGCNRIPAPTAESSSLYAFLDNAVGFYYFSDEGFEPYLPYYYQAHTELGYPNTTMSGVIGLSNPRPPTLEEGVLPAGVSPTYNSAAVEDIAQWLRSEGSELLFIYGEHDPWTAAPFDVSEAGEAYIFIAPQGTHLSDIRDLWPEDRRQVITLLETWTGIDIS
jgi:hypothetical protein